MSKSYRAPKRTVVRSNSNVVLQATVAQESRDIYICTSARETVVRIVGFMNMQWQNVTSGEAGVAIVKLRKDISDPIISLVDGDPIVEDEYVRDVMWSFLGSGHGAVGGPSTSFNQLIDVKGMRKMRVGDKMVLLTLGSQANQAKIRGNLNVFAKET